MKNVRHVNNARGKKQHYHTIHHRSSWIATKVYWPYLPPSPHGWLKEGKRREHWERLLQRSRPSVVATLWEGRGERARVLVSEKEYVVRLLCYSLLNSKQLSFSLSWSARVVRMVSCGVSIYENPSQSQTYLALRQYLLMKWIFNQARLLTF